MHQLLETLNDPAFHLAGAPTSWAELLGFVTGIITVSLAAAGRVSTFAWGMLNSAFFCVLFVDARLFADASLQIVFICLGVQGWWAWLRFGPNHTELQTSSASPALLLTTAAGVVVAALILIPILDAAGDSAPVLDGTTTAMSLGAQALLNLRKVQSWYVWIAVDLIYVPLYLSRDLLLTAIVYVVFLGICVSALRSWRAEVQGTRPTANTPAVTA
ncbi:Nicotinamide riboside transporter PnuC [Paraconexibacter sp. AEG42_29]|uniref:Nicotinamide riboside transporter PnuC n=1 Tax=Paraconexibacter sp. AEG42_29 TaxID=2997339 RepID=A0AAU7AUB8_9ACTN